MNPHDIDANFFIEFANYKGLTIMRMSICLFIILITPHAFADGWKLFSGNIELDIKGSASRDQSYQYLSVRTANPDTPEVRFSCSEQHGLKTTIIFEPMSTREEQSGALKLKVRRASLEIENREKEMAMWTHIRETRTIQNRGGKAARMLFNAVYQNANFVIKEPLGDKASIDLPAVDEAFELFTKMCHITNGS